MNEPSDFETDEAREVTKLVAAAVALFDIVDEDRDQLREDIANLLIDLQWERSQGDVAEARELGQGGTRDLIRQIKDHLWQAHALARRIPIGTHTFGLGEPEPAYFDYRRDIAFCDRLLRTAERRTALPNREAYDKDRAASAALRIMRRYKQATPTTRRSDNRFLKLAAILCGEPDNVLGMAPAGRRAVEAGRVSTEK